MFYITREIKEKIFLQGRSELPNEACGYLAGNENRASLRIALTNVDESPEHFSFDPEEQFAASKKAREAGLRLNAVYHTHPETPARPSEEDIKLAFDKNMVYIIASLIEGKEDIKAFRIQSGEVSPIPLEVTDYE